MAIIRRTKRCKRDRVSHSYRQQNSPSASGARACFGVKMKPPSGENKWLHGELVPVGAFAFRVQAMFPQLLCINSSEFKLASYLTESLAAVAVAGLQ